MKYLLLALTLTGCLMSPEQKTVTQPASPSGRIHADSVVQVDSLGVREYEDLKPTPPGNK